MNGKPDVKPASTVLSINDNVLRVGNANPFLCMGMNSIPVRSIKQLNEQGDHAAQVLIHDLAELCLNGPIDQSIHRHDFFFLLILKEGSGRHTIDFISYKVENRCLYLMRPGQVHQLYLKRNSSGYILQFSRDFVFSDLNKSLKFLRGMGKQVLFRISEQSMKQLLHYLALIFEESGNPKIAGNEVVKSLVHLVLIEIYRHSDHLTPAQGLKEKYRQEQFNAFLNYLETYYVSKKQVNDYAKLMNMTPYRLNYITKTLVGKTCSTLINEHLITEAKRQLLATTKQVNEVAFYLGYEDTSYFIRFFKKHMGTSPSSYRKNFR
ncbi:MAG: helix-turn-helix transcriptional regulator [Bacteroidota bacterium]